MNHQKIASRMQELIRRLEAGDRVSQGSLKRVLTNTQFANLESETLKPSAREPKPVEIERYETLLRRSSRLCKKYEERHSELPEESSAKLFEKARQKLEEAHLYASGLLLEKPILRVWFDRDPASADLAKPDSFPRIVSPSVLTRDRKLDVLRAALKNLRDESGASQTESEATALA